MATTNTRTANRSPVTLKIKFKSETLNQFIERYSVDISHGGIFIRTKDPLPVGTALRFEFQLKDASPLITGDGTVVWTREFDPTRSGVAPGMGVRFDRLPGESQEILEQILAYKSAKLGGDNGSEVPAFLDVPTKVAQLGPSGQPITGATPFGEVPTRVTPAHVLKSLQQGDDPRRTLIGIGMSQLKSNGATESDKTPLPRPLPFHADLDEFPDEAFEEATKVAELEALAKKSAEEQGEGYGASMDDDVTMQRSKRPTAPAPEELTAAAAAASMADSAELAANKFQSVAAFDRAMRSGMADDDDDEGGFAHFDQRAAAAVAAQAQPAEYRPQPQMVEQTVREDMERDGGSSLPWIIAAAIVLVVASIGGFLLLNKEDEKKDRQAQVPVAPQDEQPVAAPTLPTEPPPQPTPPVKPGLEAVVTSVPEGAMAELVGEGQSGTTPMTFRGLEQGKKYTVRLSSDGFTDTEMSFEAGGEAPKPVELVAKPVVLKVTSTPPGAAVFIDGQKQKGATPASITLAGKLAGKKQLKLSVRRSGYSNADQRLALDNLVDGGETMTQEVAVTLVKRAGRPAGGGSGKTGGVGASGGDKPPDGSGGDKPPDGSGGDKPPDGSGGDKPPDGSGGDKQPDGTKPAEKPAEGAKPADKPAEKAPDKSGAKAKDGAKDGATKAASSGEPTPEWSK